MFTLCRLGIHFRRGLAVINNKTIQSNDFLVLAVQIRVLDSSSLTNIHPAFPRAERRDESPTSSIGNQAKRASVIAFVWQHIATKNKIQAALFRHPIGISILQRGILDLTETIRLLAVGHALTDTTGEIHNTQLAHQLVHWGSVRISALRHTVRIHHLPAILEQFQFGKIRQTSAPLPRQIGNDISIIVIIGSVLNHQRVRHSKSPPSRFSSERNGV